MDRTFTPPMHTSSEDATSTTSSYLDASAWQRRPRDSSRKHPSASVRQSFAAPPYEELTSINYADARHGAALVGWSSQIEVCAAKNVLIANDKIWLSQATLPQHICISLANRASGKELVIRTIGWHCWHSYTTNPHKVLLRVSSDGTTYRLWDTFTAERFKGTQLFCCVPILVSLYPFLQLEVASTFGGLQTYLNRVYLYEDEMSASPLRMSLESAAPSDHDHDIRDALIQSVSTDSMATLDEIGTIGVDEIGTIGVDTSLFEYRADASEDDVALTRSVEADLFPHSVTPPTLVASPLRPASTRPVYAASVSSSSQSSDRAARAIAVRLLMDAHRTPPPPAVARDRSHRSDDRSHRSDDRSHRSEDRSHRSDDRSHRSEDRSHRSDDRSHRSDSSHRSENRSHRSEDRSYRSDSSHAVTAAMQASGMGSPTPMAPISSTPKAPIPPMAPNPPTHMAPIASTSMAPIAPTPMAPISSTPKAPIPPTPVAPIASTPMAPIASTPMAPIASTPMAPISTTPKAPIASTPMAPIASTPMAPIPSDDLSTSSVSSRSSRSSVLLHRLGALESKYSAMSRQVERLESSGRTDLSTPMAPISTTHMAPVSSIPMAPISTTPMAPISTTHMAPISSIPMAPISSTPMAPISPSTVLHSLSRQTKLFQESTRTAIQALEDRLAESRSAADVADAAADAGTSVRRIGGEGRGDYGSVRGGEGGGDSGRNAARGGYSSVPATAEDRSDRSDRSKSRERRRRHVRDSAIQVELSQQPLQADGIEPATLRSGLDAVDASIDAAVPSPEVMDIVLAIHGKVIERTQRVVKQELLKRLSRLS